MFWPMSRRCPPNKNSEEAGASGLLFNIQALSILGLLYNIHLYV